MIFSQVDQLLPGLGQPQINQKAQKERENVYCSAEKGNHEALTQHLYNHSDCCGTCHLLQKRPSVKKWRANAGKHCHLLLWWSPEDVMHEIRKALKRERWVKNMSKKHHRWSFRGRDIQWYNEPSPSRLIGWSAAADWSRPATNRNEVFPFSVWCVLASIGNTFIYGVWFARES